MRYSNLELYNPDTYKKIMGIVSWYGNKLRSPEERIIARAKESRRILKRGPKRF